MKLSKEDKNLIFYSAILIINIVLFCLTMQINNRGKVIAESPKLLPLITVSIIALISIIGIFEALIRNGRFHFKATLSYLKEAFINNKKILLSISIVGLYILLTLTVSFYLSSFVLITACSYIYVKRLKIYWAIIISAAITVALYLIFAVGFQLYLR